MTQVRCLGYQNFMCLFFCYIHIKNYSCRLHLVHSQGPHDQLANKKDNCGPRHADYQFSLAALFSIMVANLLWWLSVAACILPLKTLSVPTGVSELVSVVTSPTVSPCLQKRAAAEIFMDAGALLTHIFNNAFWFLYAFFFQIRLYVPWDVKFYFSHRSSGKRVCLWWVFREIVSLFKTFSLVEVIPGFWAEAS